MIWLRFLCVSLFFAAAFLSVVFACAGNEENCRKFDLQHAGERCEKIVAAKFPCHPQSRERLDNCHDRLFIIQQCAANVM